jgi:hypothetical protein
MANEGVGVGCRAALFDNDDNGLKHQAVLFDYVDDDVNVELDADDKDRAVRWRQ